ncbi:acyl-CoA dehydrogenase family protein [Motiliproteus sp.]|uniref:acyl-CoA dehydrogenase family protein n=1 Tax=Motiliproteus sp. TaxID=1898955 RepID=UPI003BAD74FA
MSDYFHPYRDAEFILENLVNFDELSQQLNLDGVNQELASAVISEAGRFASEVLAPLNSVGDQQGATLNEQGVQQTPGFSEAYQQFAEAGWTSLTAEEEFGGQQLPQVLGTAVNEIWHSANMAFALCPMLSQGAIEALCAHGSEVLQQQYLEHLISGRWTGTMNLTEPNAGSDLAAVSTKAVAEGDHYRISGQKIFITWGDHQMTDNIVHLVLARLPDAPAGVKGISLFVVPKFLLDENGEPAEMNDVRCVSLEHKLGIHGSPTCVLSFGDEGGAIGYLVGEPNRGLMYMFTMMNSARQSVGLQGLSISERAYQQGLSYARERTQGKRADGSAKPIIEYPDVRRMLLTLKTGSEAMRALALVASAELDRAQIAGDAEQAKAHQLRAELMTPIVKGWMTEFAQELTSLNVQIHGGMGFIEETGAAQHFRDARILPIYEGTTGIQALDLIGRKLQMDQGESYRSLLAELTQTARQLETGSDPRLAKTGRKLLKAIDAASSALRKILEEGNDRAELNAGICVHFLMLSGFLVGGGLLGQAAVAAAQLQRQAEESGQALDPLWDSKISSAEFFAVQLLPRVGYLAEICAAESLSAMAGEECFEQ